LEEVEQIRYAVAFQDPLKQDSLIKINPANTRIFQQKAFVSI